MHSFPRKYPSLKFTIYFLMFFFFIFSIQIPGCSKDHHFIWQKMDKHGINRKVFDVAFGNFDPIDHRVFDLAFGRFDPIDVTVFDAAFACPNGPCNRPPINQIPDRQGPLIEEVHESSTSNENPVANSESNNVKSSQPASRTPLKKIETAKRSLVEVSNFANPKVIKKPSQPVSCNEEAEESLDLLENLDDGEDEFFESSQPPQASNRPVQSQKAEEVTTYDFVHANNKLSSLPQSGGNNSSSGSRPASQEEEDENDELEEDVQPSQGFNSNNGILRSLYNIFGDGSQVENFESERIDLVMSEPSTSSGKQASIAAIATNVSEESSISEKGDCCQTETSAHQGKDHTQEEPSAKEKYVTQVTKDSLVSNSSNAPKIKAFKCFACPAVFLRKFSTKGHFETKHPNEKYDSSKILAIKFVCYECVLAFEIYGQLEDHFTQSHQETIDPVKVILENTQTTASELLKRKPKARNNAIDDSQSQASHNSSESKAKGDAPENVKNNLSKAAIKESATNTPVKIATSKPIKVVSGGNVIEIPAGAIFMESGTDATTWTPKVTKVVTKNVNRLSSEFANAKSPKRPVTESSKVSDFANQKVEKKKSGTTVPSECCPPKSPVMPILESFKASELETPKAIKNLMINEVTDVQDNIVSSPRVRKTPVRFGDSNTKLDVTRVPIKKIETPTTVTSEHASLESPQRSLIEVSDVSNFMTPQITNKSLMEINDCTPDCTMPKSKHASPESPKRSLIPLLRVISNFATPIKKSLLEVNEVTDVQNIISTPRMRKSSDSFADSNTQFATPKISEKPMIEKAQVATPKGTKKSFMGVLEVSDTENIILTPRVRKTPSRFASLNTFNETPVKKIVSPKIIAEAQITEAPSMSKSSGKRRFTQFQREELEKEFNIDSYVSSERRLKLSQSINLTEKQIKHWFSDKRLKAKKGNHAKESKNTGLNIEPSVDKARNAQAPLSNESQASPKQSRARKRKVKPTSTIVKDQVITDENQGVQNLANLSEDEITQSPMESQASQGTNSTQKPVIAGATSVKSGQRLKRVAKSHVIASESQSIQNQASQDKRIRTLSPQKLLPISVSDHSCNTSAKGLGGLV